MRVLAIDPGETCGIATVDVEQDYVEVVKLSERASEHVRGLSVIAPLEVASVSPGHVYDLLERPSLPGREFDIVVCEEFKLYPWMASQQAHSDFPTVQHIGVVKYLAARHGLPLYMQATSVKRKAREFAVDMKWSMPKRWLGSGKGRYHGPDFDYPGEQHGRDALAHAVYWARTHPHSPLYEVK